MSKKGKLTLLQRLSKKQLIDYIKSINASDYTARRNYLGGSTQISEYITRGAISLPQVRDLILINNSANDAFKLINELSWREYWQLVWRVRGDEIFEYIKLLPFKPRQGIPTAVLNANTGITVLDEGIRQLKDTGYIDNHMRMWIAGLVCNVARCDWKIGANWMHSYLIDGDFASNHLSWQWVAGSYTGKAYLPQQDNINKYSNTEQPGSYLDKPYEVLEKMEIPPELLEITGTLPSFGVTLPQSTINVQELSNEPEILLYSPWTLDPDWLPKSKAPRVLLIDEDMFRNTYSQNVLDSIMWFANEIKDLKILCAEPQVLSALHTQIIRKDYPGTVDWPGRVEKPELLYSAIPEKFYPSFSSYWKQVEKLQLFPNHRI